jgi:hypothetical protein
MGSTGSTIIDEPTPHNAARQPHPEAGAQRTLEGVGWTRGLGAGEGRDPVLSRLLPGPGASL